MRVWVSKEDMKRSPESSHNKDRKCRLEAAISRKFPTAKVHWWYGKNPTIDGVEYSVSTKMKFYSIGAFAPSKPGYVYLKEVR